MKTRNHDSKSGKGGKRPTRHTHQFKFHFVSVRAQSAAIIGTAVNAALEQEKMADLVEQSRTS
jgi:hypothetical protein